MKRRWMQTDFPLFFVVPLVSFPGVYRILLLRTGSFQRQALGQALCPKLGKNVHLGPLLISQGLIQPVLLDESLRNRLCFKLTLIKQISYK